jgi:alpha-ribazole phosphatase
VSGEAQLWLIRHAPVDGPRGVLHDHDAPANLGDVTALAALSGKLPANAIAFCSPSRRTVETAQALGLIANKEPAFREQSFGTWTGRRHKEIEAELGGAAYREFWRSPATNRPPDGESFTDQIERVAAGLNALPAGDVILVVHSGTIRSALAIALGISAESALRFVIDPLSVTRIDRLDNDWRIVAVNRR